MASYLRRYNSKSLVSEPDSVSNGRYYVTLVNINTGMMFSMRDATTELLGDMFSMMSVPRCLSRTSIEFS
jgi:hypothetical protein